MLNRFIDIGFIKIESPRLNNTERVCEYKYYPRYLESTHYTLITYGYDDKMDYRLYIHNNIDGSFVNSIFQLSYEGNEVYLDNKFKRQKNRFDAQSGIENVLKTEDRVDYICPTSYIIDDDNFIEDMFSTPCVTGDGRRTQTFTLNEKKYGISKDGVFNYDLSNKDIPQLIEKFKIEFKSYLDYYTEKYGKYEVKYGIVNYGS